MSINKYLNVLQLVSCLCKLVHGFPCHYYDEIFLFLFFILQGSSQRESGDTGESLSSQGTKSMYARESLIVINYKKLNQDLKDVSHSRQTFIFSFLFFLSFFWGVRKLSILPEMKMIALVSSAGSLQDILLPLSH